MEITAYDIAERYVGIREIPGSEHNPHVLAMLRLDSEWPEGDEVPWCSAFVNWVAWILRLPRSKSLRARSWLRVGTPVPLSDARAGFDVVVLSRGSGRQPGPEVIEAPGHVGFYAGQDAAALHVLGGNQSDTVSVAPYGKTRLLGVRRLYRPGDVLEKTHEAASQAAQTDRPTLRQGNVGPAVERVQDRLGITTDGIYGPATESAVRSFQEDQGLTVDGTVGPNTWAALLGETEA